MIFERLTEEGTITGHCSGRGTCGKCTIQFSKAAPLPTARDRSFFTPQQLRDGYRLACQIRGNCEFPYSIPDVKKKKMTIVSGADFPGWMDIMQTTYRNPDISTVAAIDVGTTTIAMELIDAGNGTVLESYCCLNPQRKFGADVLSRMEASIQGYREELKASVAHTLETGLNVLCARQKPDIVVLAGNTAMCHLLLGLDVSSLAVAPFAPVTTAETYIRIGIYDITVMPQISAFVGGDITAGIYGTNMGQTQENILFLDLGTNGEMVLGNSLHMLCTATAAGPAFEGGVTGEVIGTDVIKLTAGLLEDGLIDETGLMAEPYFEEGIEREGIHLYQRDIRNFQMAKAAVRAGIYILMKEGRLNYEQIDKVYLAGGFGYYLDIRSAVRVGLIPAELEDKTRAVGNTSLVGAYLYGRSGCLKSQLEFLSHTESMNLAEHREFPEAYLDSMNF